MLPHTPQHSAPLIIGFSVGRIACEHILALDNGLSWFIDIGQGRGPVEAGFQMVWISRHDLGKQCCGLLVATLLKGQAAVLIDLLKCRRLRCEGHLCRLLTTTRGQQYQRAYNSYSPP